MTLLEDMFATQDTTLTRCVRGFEQLNERITDY
jgi:hypothetical protein